MEESSTALFHWLPKSYDPQSSGGGREIILAVCPERSDGWQDSATPLTTPTARGCLENEVTLMAHEMLKNDTQHYSCSSLLSAVIVIFTLLSRESSIKI